MIGRGVSGPFLTTVSIVVALSVTGCSADITRLSNSSLGMNDGPSTTGSVSGRSSSLGDAASEGGGRSDQRMAAAPVDRRFEPAPYQPAYRPPPPAQPDRTYAPPAPSAGYAPAPRYEAPVPRYEAPAPRYAPPTPRLEPREVAAPVSAGRQTISVRQGDTLYGLARQHATSVSALMKANGLTTSQLKIGQRLIVPGADDVTAGSVAPRRTASPRAAAPSSEFAGVRYVVKAGDSLYEISRATGVKVADLMRMNAITDPRRVRPGTVLRLRSGSVTYSKVTTSTETIEDRSVYGTPRLEPRGRDLPASEAVAERGAPAISNQEMSGREVSAAPTQPGSRDDNTRTRIASRGDVQPIRTPVITVPGTQPRILNGANRPTPVAPQATPSRTAAVEPNASTAPSATDTPAGNVKFRWPARGRVIGGFGPRKDGVHSDGIKIAVAMGTEVHAAEGGVIAYAGRDLEDYGNLILISHDNGWVSAYAHNETLLVARGTRVARGQVIAKAGKTGKVDQPQIHFELRDGATPVDPLRYLDKP